MRYLLGLILLLTSFLGISQSDEDPKKFVLDANQFYGSILLHNPDISHLITNHPAGVILGISRKTYGQKEWEADFGYPDTGYTFVYQNTNNPTLGDHFGLYGHYNFYFLKRNVQLRVAQGLAYNTNPYDKDVNFRNNAYGSHILSSTLLMLNYHKENLFAGLGVNAGLSFIHYSNANFKAPNTSTNTFAFNIGLTYNLDHETTYKYLKPESTGEISEPVRYNLVFRVGANESDVINMGRYGFAIVSAYADKRLGKRIAIQLGTDIFFSNFLKELIRYQSISFPELDVDPDADYKRVGVFIGHELFVNKMSVVAQLGYYVYYPFDFEGKIYNRIGMKRYFGEKIFGAVTLKSHGAKAEAVEFGIGIRL
ncbi:acyloxyacyl hydrolase [Allomuricauda sp. XS_ASV26]|uniref:acyloxyacyl hydrolase n=1 Tax=Allomuricauda sp. XS_ASV26 TaxID=3241292 RepID=UPI0035176159